MDLVYLPRKSAADKFSTHLIRLAAYILNAKDILNQIRIDVLR